MIRLGISLKLNDQLTKNQTKKSNFFSFDLSLALKEKDLKTSFIKKNLKLYSCFYVYMKKRE